MTEQRVAEFASSRKCSQRARRHWRHKSDTGLRRKESTFFISLGRSKVVEVANIARRQQRVRHVTRERSGPLTTPTDSIPYWSPARSRPFQFPHRARDTRRGEISAAPHTVSHSSNVPRCSWCYRSERGQLYDDDAVSRSQKWPAEDWR